MGVDLGAVGRGVVASLDGLRTTYHQLWEWTHTLVTVGPSVTHGPTILAVLAIVVYGAVSVQHASTEPEALHWLQRLLVFAVFVAGAVMVVAANYVYWTEPFSDQVGGVQPRYFMPLVALVPVAVGPLPFKWARASNARFPIAALLVPVLVAFCVILTFRMY